MEELGSGLNDQLSMIQDQGSHHYWQRGVSDLGYYALSRSLTLVCNPE